MIISKQFYLSCSWIYILDLYLYILLFPAETYGVFTLSRVRTGPRKPGKSWNFVVAFFRTGKPWKNATGPGKFWKSV